MKYLLFVKKIEFAVSSFVLSLAAAHASECPSKLERIENSSLIAQCQFRRSLPAGRGQSVVYEDYSGRKFQNIKACVYGVLRSYGEQILFDAKLIDADAIFESNPSTAAAASLSDYRSFLNRDGTPIRLERDGFGRVGIARRKRSPSRRQVLMEIAEWVTSTTKIGSSMQRKTARSRSNIAPSVS